MNSFSHILGNDPIKGYLAQAILNKAIGNAFLFTGPEGIGKGLFAEAFAKQILNTAKDSHPDIHIYKPEGKSGMHSMQSIRQLISEVYIAPFQAPKKLFILHNADRMLATSANALLKTFEEPPLDTIFILLADNLHTILPTIQSRCRIIRFGTIPSELIADFLIRHRGKNREEAALLAEYAEGSIGKALQEQSFTNSLQEFLEASTKSYPDILLISKQIGAGLEQEKKEIEARLRQNISTENLHPAQIATLEKEIEGAISVRISQEVLTLLRHLLIYFLKKFKAEPNFNLKAIQQAILEAKSAFQQSTPFQSCLESLLLKIKT